jgi:polygalacturonase
MVKQTKSVSSLAMRAASGAVRLASIVLAASPLAMSSCSASKPIAAVQYMCDTSPVLSPAPADGSVCGAGDATIGDEPTLPATVCQTLVANRFASDTSLPDENNQDTTRIQAALTACKGIGAVKLVSDGGSNNAFIASHLIVDSVTLWIDAGATLYASRNADLYQSTGSCGLPGINDSSACTDFITVQGTSPEIVGDGTIDGQGGEPLVGHDYSWWQLSYALREVDGSIGNPTLINLQTGTTGFVLYRITLHNSPKFHVKLTSNPVGVCDSPGKGFKVWGITLLTPSKWMNSQGLLLSPSYARNTDGIDPGANSTATCGVIACSTISTGDDHIAIKGGHYVSHVVIAHDHFGTGHGMSIGSETYGAQGTNRGVDTVDVHDLTIDADSRPVGADANPGDFNGIRIKSDESRGGLVNNITFNDICMRDMTNTILISTAYNPLFAGTSYPDFRTLSFHNVHHVTCGGLGQPVVTLDGFSAVRPAGPITLDNVIVDNIDSEAVSAQFSNIVLGPGAVNFTPSGLGVTVTNNITAGSTPHPCVFPTLPAPHPPAGWSE